MMLHQVASGDEDGTICLWDLTTGRQEGHFNEAHGSAKLVGWASFANAALLAAHSIMQLKARGVRN